MPLRPNWPSGGHHKSRVANVGLFRDTGRILAIVASRSLRLLPTRKKREVGVREAIKQSTCFMV